MRIWNSVGKFTVLQQEECSGSFRISFNRILNFYGLLQVPLLTVLLLCHSVLAQAPDASVPSEAKLTAASDSEPPQSADLPTETLLTDSPHPLSHHQPPAANELAHPRPVDNQHVARPPAPVPELVSKTQFLKAVPSHQAADLIPDPLSLSSLGIPSVQPDVVPPEWLVATTQVPVLPQPPAVPVASKSEDTNSPPRSRFPALTQPSFTLAADPGNPELPPVFNCPNPDPELGCIRIQNPFVPPEPPPILYLTPRVDFFRSNNLLLGIDPINAGLVRPTLTLLAIPPLGRDTYLLASVDGAFNRYFEVPQFNYDELRIRAGILQRLSPTMTAEIGWTNQQLFIASNEIPGFPAGTRFLNDQAVRLELSRRDQLSDRLFLNSVYQFRVSFSNPEDRSRILNVLFLSLNYDLNPNRTVQLAIDYQFSAANYTVVKRTDIYQQLLGRVTLNAFRNSQLSLYGGISFGDSTEPGIDFNSYVLGVSMAVNWALF